MNRLKQKAELLLISTIVAGFAIVSAQRLGEVPMPDSGDESMILQVPYEILNQGKFAWPMYRFLGGDIENHWHSFRPAYYWLMTGFFKITGWGLAQGRAFTLLSACLLLILVYMVGRRLFDWRAGLIATLMLVCDPTFLERARMVRNEPVAMMLALGAYFIYEQAEDRNRTSMFIASGAVAGAAVLTHTNVIYLLVAIGLLILLKRGKRAFSSTPLYLFGGSAIAVIAYEIVSDLTDLANVRLQYHGDRAHFTSATGGGILTGLMTEPSRYKNWYGGAEVFPFSAMSPALLHFFQALALIAVGYLVVAAVRKFRSGGAMADGRVRIIITTLVAVMFLAFATGPRRKNVIYVVYLSPWFALCAGILVRDGWNKLREMVKGRWRSRTSLSFTLVGATACAILAFSVLFVRQSSQYLRAVRDPNAASFEELKSALRSIVPEGVCPVSIVRPVVWLAFPEADRCFASIENRMADKVDIEGKEFALLMPGRRPERWTRRPIQEYHLLGQVRNTVYGDFLIYYLGTDPKYRSLAPKAYEFNGNQRGFRAVEPELPELPAIGGPYEQ